MKEEKSTARIGDKFGKLSLRLPAYLRANENPFLNAQTVDVTLCKQDVLRHKMSGSVPGVPLKNLFCMWLRTCAQQHFQ